MFKISILFLLVSSVSWAQQQPVDAVIAEIGYTRFPVLQCPATNEAVKSFRQKIQKLKASIKSEAQCDGIKTEVEELNKLVTKRRAIFFDLIAKGQIEGLNLVEQGTVEDYVMDLTVTTSNLLAVISGKHACFDEDKQGMSLEFLTSLIGEGSKLLAVVGGPQLGPIIGIAGEAITGFMKAMKTIQDTRQGYRFHIGEQRIAYAENLCTLYDYHRELETMMVPYDSIERLEQLQVTLKRQLRILTNKCPECAQLKDMVEQKVLRATVDGEIVETTEQVWSADFEKLIADQALVIDGLYTKRLGTHTYRSLKIASWIPLRLAALEAAQFTPDVVLATVLEEQASVEKFMVDNQAPKYIRQLVKNAEASHQEIVQQINGATFFLSNLNGTEIEPLWGGWYSTPYQSSDDYYALVFEALDKVRNVDDENVRAQVNTFFKDVEAKTRVLNVNLDVAANYCTFFAKADWFRRGIASECSSDQLKLMRQEALILTNYRLLIGSTSGALDKNPPKMPQPVEQIENLSVDWAESIKRNVEAQALESDYIKRKN